ncbi:MAG: RNase adapter RapZ [Desulfuromonadales bacterium]|nr:RNase adapter RapZ [Desulfuromonadales bacterium]
MTRHLVVITGLSGSGKSTGARALEDHGFFVVDNLPLVMLPDFLARTDRDHDRVAVVADARSSEFLSDFDAILATIRAEGHRVDVLYFEADDTDLVRRFSETRRRHPLVKAAGIVAAIAGERELMADLRRAATVLLDTTGENVHQLRRRVLTALFGSETETTPMKVQILSFGFRNGLPLEADLVFDVRFLDNPHFVDALRPLSGLDRPVSEFVLRQQDSQILLEKLGDLLDFLLPRYQKEGKASLTVALGCTGGRHRSVSLAKALHAHVLGSGHAAELLHRDIDLQRT